MASVNVLVSRGENEGKHIKSDWQITRLVPAAIARSVAEALPEGCSKWDAQGEDGSLSSLQNSGKRLRQSQAVDTLSAPPDFPEFGAV